MANRKLKMGMVGGGEGAFIGAVHRKAALMDEQIEMAAGAFSSDPAKAKGFASRVFIDQSRAYGSYAEMAEREAALPDGEKIDFVSIVTPNHLHFDVSKTFLEAGFHVVCDKPMTVSLEQAEQLKKIVDRSGKVFALTHNYTGYPMVREARQLVAGGKIGQVMKVVVEYPQDWLLSRLELDGQKQALWRTDPAKAGPAGCLGDIGSHCENLASYITGLEITELCADLTTFARGRLLDDDVNVLLRYENGARGVLHASQISAGEENNLNIRIYGSEGSLRWHQENPNYLHVSRPGEPVQVYRRGNGYLSEQAAAASRIPPGHPEAFIEAFANIYLGAISDMKKKDAGGHLDLNYPTVVDGLRGMAFIETVIESANSDRKWTPFKKY